MPTFRTKPLEFEAWQFCLPLPGPSPDWVVAGINDAFGDGEKVPGSTLCIGGIVRIAETLHVGTRAGLEFATQGDWIIRDKSGGLHVWPTSLSPIFGLLFEPVA